MNEFRSNFFGLIRCSKAFLFVFLFEAVNWSCFVYDSMLMGKKDSEDPNPTNVEYNHPIIPHC